MIEEENKFSIKKTFTEAIRSRVFLTLFVIIIIEAIAFIVLVLSMGKIGVPQVPVRYDGFSFTEIFRQNGSYMINFAVFGAIVAVTNILISLKVYYTKGRAIALGVLWLTVVVFVILMIILLALLETGSVL